MLLLLFFLTTFLTTLTTFLTTKKAIVGNRRQTSESPKTPVAKGKTLISQGFSKYRSAEI